VLESTIAATITCTDANCDYCPMISSYYSLENESNSVKTGPHQLLPVDASATKVIIDN